MKVSTFIAHKKYYFLVIGAVIVIGAIFSIVRSGNGEFETAKVIRKDLIEKSSVTGKVTPNQKADLSFEKGGKIASITVRVGDRVVKGARLGTLEASDTWALLKGAQANVLVEQAKLVELERGTRPEEITINETKLTNARSVYGAAVRDAYIKAEDAVRNKADILFDNANSVNPEVKNITHSQTETFAINSQRLKVNQVLSSWGSELQSGIQNPTPQFIEKVHTNLTVIKDFLNALSNLTIALSVNNSGSTQATIDTYRSTVSAALTQVNGVFTALVNAETTVQSAVSELALAKSGSTAETVIAQRARVAQAEASVLNYQAILAQSEVISPISGIVTKVVPEVGETVNARETAFAVMSSGSFKVEVDIPEASIARITIGNKAKVTLDAYGPDVVFLAAVTMIDPAETIVEGVPTYKVTLQFDETDPRIRSGMTANIDLTTQTKEAVLAVPSRAVYTKNSSKYVRLVNVGSSSRYEEIPVTTGVRSTDGFTEIQSGLQEGDTVVTYIAQ